ncbi:MAG TPA: hypothetical protein VGW76_10390 [Pyrinomonadaceae bacterium]|nr:hypothetical protein [Pyrinomonadaceae bacterium]
MRSPIQICQRIKSRYLRLSFALSVLVLLPVAVSAQIEITLKNSFIEKFKNRVTVDTTFTVDKAHKHPNTAKKDADLHIAGRAPEIGLPIVAEIMNAKGEEAALDLIHSVEGTNQTIKLSGAWRLWCEHGGESQQIQGAQLNPFTTTNPDHVFEIHPITSLNGKSVTRSLKPIKDFPTKDAETAFMSYENKRSQIISNGAKKTTTIITSMGGFNYVEFKMEIIDDLFAVPDGTLVFAKVLDLDDEVLVQKRRMVFVKDSEPEKAVKKLHKGDIMHVLGVPRINLALVSYRRTHAKTQPGILTWNLPYEMLIVGVYEN